MRDHPGGWFVDMQDHEDFKYTDNLPLGQVTYGDSSSTQYSINVMYIGDLRIASIDVSEIEGVSCQGASELWSGT